MAEMVNSMENFNSKLDPREERIYSLDIGYLKGMKINEESLWDAQDIIKKLPFVLWKFKKKRRGVMIMSKNKSKTKN